MPVVKTPIKAEWGNVYLENGQIPEIYLLATLKQWTDATPDKRAVIGGLKGVADAIALTVSTMNSETDKTTWKRYYHNVTKALVTVNLFLDDLESFDATTFNAGGLGDQLSMLGSCIRLKLDHDGKLDLIKYLYDNLGANYKWMTQVWPFIGEDIMSLFGEWDRTKPKKQDDAIAGMFALLYWVSYMIALQAYSNGDLLNNCVSYADPNSLGIVRPFRPDDPSTWDLTIFNNAYFGLSTSMVNDPLVRDTYIPIINGAEGLANKLLSKSSWVWRYGHNIMVKMLFAMSLWADNINDNLASDMTDKVFSAYSGYYLFAQGDGDNYSNVYAFVRDFRNTIPRVTSNYYMQKVFGSMKKVWTDKRLIDLKLQSSGKGGMMFYSELVNDEDEANLGLRAIDYKVLDVPSNTAGVLRRYESTTDDYYKERLEEIPLEDYKLLFAMGASRFYDSAGNLTDMGPNVDTDHHEYGWCFLSVKDGFVLYRSKTESREYLTSQTAACLGDWITGYGLIYMGAANHDLVTDDGSHPHFAGTYMGKATMLASGRRTLDPMKKVDHNYDDINSYDFGFLREKMLNTLVPGMGSKAEMGSTKTFVKKEEAKTTGFEISATTKEKDLEAELGINGKTEPKIEASATIKKEELKKDGK